MFRLTSRVLSSAGAAMTAETAAKLLGAGLPPPGGGPIDAKQLKKLYREAAKSAHPDVAGGSEAKMRDVKEAFELLQHYRTPSLEDQEAARRRREGAEQQDSGEGTASQSSDGQSRSKSGSHSAGQNPFEHPKGFKSYYQNAQAFSQSQRAYANAADEELQRRNEAWQRASSGLKKQVEEISDSAVMMTVMFFGALFAIILAFRVAGSAIDYWRGLYDRFRRGAPLSDELQHIYGLFGRILRHGDGTFVGRLKPADEGTQQKVENLRKMKQCKEVTRQEEKQRMSLEVQWQRGCSALAQKMAHEMQLQQPRGNSIAVLNAAIDESVR